MTRDRPLATRRRWRRAAIGLGWPAALAAIAVGLIVVDRRLTDTITWTTVLNEPLDPTLWLAAGTGVGWVVWGWLLYTAFTAHRPRLPVPLHTAISTLTSALVLLADTITGQPQNHRPAPPPGAATTNPAPIGQPETIVMRWGWLPAPTAAAATAIIAAFWAKRRRRYQPHTPTPRPAPPSRSPAGLHHLANPTTPAANPAPRRLVCGAHGNDWLYLDQLPTRLRLTGTGAHPAGRGLLTTIATSHHAQPDTTPTLLTTATTLRHLFAPDPPPPWLTALAGVHVADSITDLLRHRPDTDNPDHGTVVLHTEPVDIDLEMPPAPGTLTTIHLDTAADTDRPHTWTINNDGTVLTGHPDSDRPAAATAEGARLAVLDPATALLLLGNAHHITDHPDNPPPTHAGNIEPDATPSHPQIADGDQPPSPGRLSLHLFGPTRLTTTDSDGTRRPVTIRRTAGRHLLVYLALHREGADTDTLKEALWPDAPGSAATQRLHTTLSELRHTLTNATNGHPVLRHTPDPHRNGHAHYWLDPDHLTVDLWHLHDLTHQATTSTNPDHRTHLLHTATRYATATLTPDITNDWIQPHRETATDLITDLRHHLTTDTAHQAATSTTNDPPNHPDDLPPDHPAPADPRSTGSRR